MQQHGTIILAEDDRGVRLATRQTLELEGFAVRDVDSGKDALALLPHCPEAILVSDVKMPGMDGFELLRAVRRLDEDLPVVLITGHGDVAMAVHAIKAGAYDFLEKPFLNEILASTARRALERRHMVLENRSRRSRMEEHDDGAERLLGNSPAMERLRATLAKLAPTPVDVLIQGETGSGKEVVARSLHRLSDRRDRPFVALNCGGLPDNLVESELFGHSQGAFTGAVKARTGRIKYADKGTLFLDEIESMSPVLQVKLLRVLQERSVLPLGSNREEPVDIRVVAATKVDLGRLAASGQFREDLYWRLNVVTLVLPSLCERLEDVPLLFQHFACAAAAAFGCHPPELLPETLQELMNHRWPGNVRELRHAAERFVLGMEPGLCRSLEPVGGARPASLETRVAAFERCLIERELAHNRGNLKATMESLDLPRKTLTDKMRRHGLSRDNYVD
ncbi:MAG: sigma-54-dependent Fis family transcriptional regulator [Methylococcaceae bacterium]|nr:sigma-54-dependent Fis family transcriptional regulator [Methylococcaceae bacterium]